MRISTSTKYIDEQLFQNNSPQAIQDFKNKYKLENFLTTLDFYPRQGNRMVYSITYQGQDVSGKEWDLVDEVYEFYMDTAVREIENDDTDFDYDYYDHRNDRYVDLADKYYW